MLKVVKETKSFLPFKAWLECLRLSKQIDKSFVYFGPLEFLDKNVLQIKYKDNMNIDTLINFSKSDVN